MGGKGGWGGRRAREHGASAAMTTRGGVKGTDRERRGHGERGGMNTCWLLKHQNGGGVKRTGGTGKARRSGEHSIEGEINADVDIY